MHEVWEWDYVHELYVNGTMCTTLWEWDYVHKHYENGAMCMYLLYDVMLRNTARILTKSSNPSRVPTISLSDFMMMWIREPMHLSTSSEGKKGWRHGAHY